MGKKKTIEEVRDIVEKEGLRLLSKEYINNNTKLEIECRCGNTFKTTIINFERQGKTTCDECTKQKMRDRFSFGTEEVKVYLKKYGWELLDEEYVNSSGKITIKNKDGYLCCTTLRDFKKTNNSKYINPKNKHTIDNIKLWIKNNNLKTNLISTKYKNCTTPLVFTCNSCGKEFKRSWATMSQKPTDLCFECTSRKTGDGNKKYTDWNEYINNACGDEYEFIEEFIRRDISGRSCRYIKVRHSDCGKVYDVLGASFVNGCRCRECTLSKNGDKQRGNMDDFIKYVRDTTGNEYDVLSTEYVIARSPVMMRHNICGHEYATTFANFKSGNRCPKCATLYSVSYTHAVLSLLFERHFKNVEFEYDAGFRTKSGAISRYDLYVKPLNMLIEWQSEYHDTKKQKEIDRQKKEYAISNGYKFRDFDHREHTLLEYVKMFFPHLEEIPDDLNLGLFQKTDYGYIQKLLNESGLSIPDISKKYNIPEHSIRNGIFNGVIKYPDWYHKKFSQNVPIVQLSLDGEFIAEYESISEATRCTKVKSIQSVLNGKNSHAKGYFWVYKDKYDNEEYNLPNKDECIRYGREIMQLDMDGNVLNTFQSMLDAEKSTGVSASTISAGIKRQCGYAKGFCWVYKDVYDSIGYYVPSVNIRKDNRIVMLDLEFTPKKVFKSYKQIECVTGAKRSNVCRAISCNTISNGHKWMYLEDYEKEYGEIDESVTNYSN